MRLHRSQQHDAAARALRSPSLAPGPSQAAPAPRNSLPAKQPAPRDRAFRKPLAPDRPEKSPLPPNGAPACWQASMYLPRTSDDAMSPSINSNFAAVLLRPSLSRASQRARDPCDTRRLDVRPSRSKKRSRRRSQPARAARNHHRLSRPAFLREIVAELSVSIGARRHPNAANVIFPRISLGFLAPQSRYGIAMQIPPEKTKPPSLRSVFRTGRA